MQLHPPWWLRLRFAVSNHISVTAQGGAWIFNCWANWLQLGASFSQNILVSGLIISSSGHSAVKQSLLWCFSQQWQSPFWRLNQCLFLSAMSTYLSWTEQSQLSTMDNKVLEWATRTKSERYATFNEKTNHKQKILETSWSWVSYFNCAPMALRHFIPLSPLKNSSRHCLKQNNWHISP